MNSFQFEYQDSLITRQEFEGFGKELLVEINRMNQARSQGLDTVYAAINVPFEQAIMATVQELVVVTKALNPSALVLIGIGGSNLGTVAIHEALHGRSYNELNPTIKFYCADTVDADQLAVQLMLVEQLLKERKKVILNVVTKSGKTTETIANFELFLDLLKRYHATDYQQYVVVTTDAGSAFQAYAVAHKFRILSIPPQVGGRYSVFTSVGLFPLALLGVDIQSLLNGARQMVPQCLDSAVMRNPAAISALIKYVYYQQCVHINDMFVFALNLQSMGLWYRQLMGESVGKELNRSNQRVEVGITPTVSVGSIDLHSVGQLYLGGPRDKFATFITVLQRKHSVTIPNMPEFEPFVAKIQGKKASVIMDGILSGVQAAYRTHQRPFCTITLPEVNAGLLGQLMQFYMMEMMYLGYLFDVNPFDQPNVESYKRETRKWLEQA
jgi:glucose-6-phosphate isomerase